MRKLVLQTAIEEQNPKVAASAVSALLQLAAVDFPAAWPGMFKELVDALSPPHDVIKAHGAIRCLTALAENSTLKEGDVYQVSALLHAHVCKIARS